MNWRNLANDPGSFSKGWFQFLWVPWLAKALTWGGNSHNPLGNNSVRLYDPATNKWETIYPNNNGTAGLQNRDNYFGFIVPRLGEFWVIGGAAGQNYGRLNIAERSWIEISGYSGASLIQDFGNFRNLFPHAHGYSTELDLFMMMCGNTLQWIEPNPAGPKPYRFKSKSAFFGERSHSQNNGVVVGTDFYFYGGGLTVVKKDFYRMDLRTMTAVRLPDAPWSLYQPVVTYDSARKVIVLHGGSVTRLTAYFDIVKEKWQDISGLGLAADGDGVRPMRNKLRAGTYCPVGDMHIYTGGNVAKDDGTSQWTYALKLDGLSLDGLGSGDTTAPSRPNRPRLVSVMQ